MDNLLRRLELKDDLSTNLQMGKADFVRQLASITDRADTGIFSDSFDIFSSSKKEFKGQIGSTGFKIKRKRRFFDTNMNTAIAKGAFSENNGAISIETEINGFPNSYILYYIFLIVFYSIVIIIVSFSNTNAKLWSIPFLLVHGTLMFFVPYFMMRRSVKRLKYELEREFYYFAKEQKQ
jgi:NADH:ubiquinone oxidoreductase subunit 3 (subunit A)